MPFFFSLASPLKSVAGSRHYDFRTTAESCARRCAGEGAEQVVLGMPYNSRGEEGEQAAVTPAPPLPVLLGILAGGQSSVQPVINNIAAGISVSDAL